MSVWTEVVAFLLSKCLTNRVDDFMYPTPKWGRVFSSERQHKTKAWKHKKRVTSHIEGECYS